uniref:Uncharacterized protein n=1 Tax=Setaria viridis TaxID=4556 RepID=A0A4U6TD79_SETVI|nr:hypothetical protein SEVIR_9G340400v2 [Setaria viridis]
MGSPKANQNEFPTVTSLKLQPMPPPSVNRYFSFLSRLLRLAHPPPTPVTVSTERDPAARRCRSRPADCSRTADSARPLLSLAEGRPATAAAAPLLRPGGGRAPGGGFRLEERGRGRRRGDL